jgi:hypothetical protein
VFLTERRARIALAAADLDPATGRARLSYRRAEEIFNETTKPLAHPDITDSVQLANAPGWTLHDLRHFVPAQLRGRDVALGGAEAARPFLDDHDGPVHCDRACRPGTGEPRIIEPGRAAAAGG